MKKILTLILTIIGSFLFSGTHAQVDFFNCSPLKFSGTAPLPWAIDGQTNDWQTLTGTYSGDPIFPFSLLGKPNATYDHYGSLDLDNPDTRIDLRVLSIIHDDYNVFFYFRKLENSNLPNKAFYFFDTNLDGDLDNGEPVIGLQFNDKKVSKLTVGTYIPANISGDAIAGEPVCQVSGHPLPGTVNEKFNSHNIALQNNEIFAAAATENGYGVELAIPWRLISQYKYFAYRLALQSGAGNYNPSQPSDNASGCALSPDLIGFGNPDFEILNAFVTTVTPGLSYKITITFKNLTPGRLIINPADSVKIENIVRQGDLNVPETGFQIKVRGIPYSYMSGTFNQQPIIYSTSTANLGLIALRMAPFSTASVDIEISFPANGSVKSANISITPKSHFSYYFDISCPLAALGGGGKPTNPIGLLVADEPPSKIYRNDAKEEEDNLNDKIIIYPNPAKGSVNLLLPNNKGSFDIQLTDYTGRLIKRWSGLGSGKINLEAIRQGFYLLSIKSGNGERCIKKLVVQ